MLRSDLHDFSGAYIVVKWYIAVTNPDDAKKGKSVAFKNNATFINFISKINAVQIDNAEYLDVVMPMYNLLEYSKNYRKTIENLWNHYRHEPSNPLSSNSESFKYNLGDSETGYDATEVGKNETESVFSLKHLSNFWRTLSIPMINCEIKLILTWSKNYALADMTVRTAGKNNGPPAIVAPTGLDFQITDTKLHVPVVTLSTGNDKKLLEQLKSGFKRTGKCNKYRIQMTIKSNNNNLSYLIDPTFTKINRLILFVIWKNCWRK